MWHVGVIWIEVMSSLMMQHVTEQPFVCNPGMQQSGWVTTYHIAFCICNATYESLLLKFYYFWVMYFSIRSTKNMVRPRKSDFVWYDVSLYLDCYVICVVCSWYCNTFFSKTRGILSYFTYNILFP